jgi:nicotinate-nucleotide adenylyltransferase
VDDRLEMLSRAVAEAANPRLGVLDIEARAGGVNYTVNTVRQLRLAWPQARMVFLLGTDQFARLHLWHEPEELAKLVEFAVFDRAGAAAAAPSLTLARVLRWRLLAGVQHPASSSEIRRRLKLGQTAEEWLPRSVAAYIEEKKLYR